MIYKYICLIFTIGKYIYTLNFTFNNIFRIKLINNWLVLHYSRGKNANMFFRNNIYNYKRQKILRKKLTVLKRLVFFYKVSTYYSKKKIFKRKRIFNLLNTVTNLNMMKLYYSEFFKKVMFKFVGKNIRCLTTFSDKNGIAFFKFLNLRILSNKLLRIYRKAQTFCIIRVSRTNIFFTITNGCGEVKFSCSAGRVGFVKKKARINLIALTQILDSVIANMALNSLSSFDRLSFINVPKFMLYHVVKGLISNSNNITLKSVWFYTKTPHSNFKSFKFRKLRRI